jgi:hypothetical protein
LPNNLAQRIYIGVISSPIKLFTTVFFIYSAAWVLLEPIVALVPEASPYLVGINRFAILVGFSLIIGLWQIARPTVVSFQFQNNKISIEFGDLFKQEGFKVIPVSRYMNETEVVSSSLQAKVIRKYLESNEGTKGIEDYLKSLDKGLERKPHEIIERGAERGIERYYPLGTSALIDNRNEQYLLIAITETELAGHIPENNCSTTNLWIALETFWKEMPVVLRGQNISIPLLGGGISGIRLSPNHLLAMNILAILNAIVDKGKITNGEIKIILHPQYLDKIDLNNFKKMGLHPY